MINNPCVYYSQNSSVTLTKQQNGNDKEILFQSRPNDWCEKTRRSCNVKRLYGTQYFIYTVSQAHFTDAGTYGCEFESNQYIFRHYEVLIHGMYTDSYV